MFPPPTPKQARVLWFSLTALAIGICVILAGMVLWGIGWVIQKLSTVLLPIAIAGVIACILSPVVDFFVRKRMPRTGAILTVFFIAALIVLGIAVTVIPRGLRETEQLVQRFPAYARFVQSKMEQMVDNPPFHLPFVRRQTNSAPGVTEPRRAPESSTNAEPVFQPDPAVKASEPSPQTKHAPRGMFEWDPEIGDKILNWLQDALPEIGAWMVSQFRRVASWFGLMTGFALIPVYVFYFLLEKKKIEKNWTDYLPLRESRAKDEFVFILGEINERLVSFFRGQVLVALCSGTLLTIGFLGMGLNYAVLLGLIAGFFGIVPYLGVLISLVPAVFLAVIEFKDWWHPLLVLGIFAAVQTLEGFYVSPRIIGNRVGLHPLTIIIALMIGTTLMGGILGGVLAIPLTAALRELMFRYIWKRRNPGRKTA